MSVVVGAAIAFGIWKGKVDTNQGHFKAALDDFMVEIRTDIKRIFERLAPPPAVRAGSPTRLTSFGEQISATLGASEWAASHAPRLTDAAAGKPEWEVFEPCVSHVTAQITQDETLKTAIRAGAHEHGTDIEQVRKVLEVELRDRVLALLNE